MIVDFRVRPPYKSFTKLHIFQPRDPNPDPLTAKGFQLDLPPYRSRDESSMGAFVEEMDEAGIDVGVVMGRTAPPAAGSVSNDEIAEILTAHPGRFVGFGSVDVTNPKSAIAEVDRCVDLGFKGIAFDNGYFPLYDDDESIFPIYERCQEKGLVASITSSLFLGPDLTYCDPVHLQRVASRFSDLKIVVPHGGWPHVTQICGVAYRHTNVYLVPDIYLNMPNTPGTSGYLEAAHSYLGRRLLFASSYPVRPMGQSVEQFRNLPFQTEELRARCLGQNAVDLLGLGA
ncbi:amidohydrolase family protein [Rhodococcus globerulus]|uniref:amidohydrolase family protein n=1 Tax=Rhodococcus globerulus TaxID=33008 RepID=UPI001C778F86|nr:amidohydrolase family protein [Rhodococcus globerulus]QXW01326.1 amidohydrolase family protein [Rhodococcus globerulus]